MDQTLDPSYSNMVVPEAALQPVLIIAWCASAQDRAGELFPLSTGPAATIGRGEGLRPVQRRPGGDVVRPTLRDPWLSRDQLRVQVSADGDLLAENAGRCPMLFHGQQTKRARLSPGDFLTLHKRLLLWYTTMPARLPTLTHGAALHRFGEPDEDGIVGEGPSAWLLREQIRLVAGRTPHVLLLGESGTGKELAAGAVHARSPRRARPLVSRNAATFPESLIDAEVFGNAKGYPNPGMPERRGLIGEADGSTLFLDEIGELSHELQAHLLRVLDMGEYQRLGESRPRTADLRMVAATNRSPETLKHDFLARFALQVRLPALAERREDIPLLIRRLLRGILREDAALAERLCTADNAAPGDGTPGEARVDLALVEALMRAAHPANVRGLNRLLWQSVLASRGKSVAMSDELTAALAPPPDESVEREPGEVTAEELRDALTRNEGVQARVWRELGLKDRYVLRRLIRKYEAEGWDFGRQEDDG